MCAPWNLGSILTKHRDRTLTAEGEIQARGGCDVGLGLYHLENFAGGPIGIGNHRDSFRRQRRPSANAAIEFVGKFCLGDKVRRNA